MSSTRTRYFKVVLAILATVTTGAVFAQETVRIGVLNDQSGPYADTGGMGSIIAARLALEDAGPMPSSLRVEIVTGDNQSKPDIAAAIARRWISNDGVNVIVDGAHTGTALAIAEVTKAAGVPFLIAGAASSDITGKYCHPLVMQFTYDTYALAKITGSEMVKRGGRSWFFIAADYAFGQVLERDATRFVKENGGSVLGTVRHPLNSPDFASFILQAQSSKAEVIGLANAGADAINTIRQAQDFGIEQSGQKLAGLLVFFSDVHALGLKSAQGLIATTSFYWDRNDETRAWTKRFLAQSNGRVPTMVHAGVYSAVKHYLAAINHVPAKDGMKVAEWMKANPVHDMNNTSATIRADGRVLHDMYLFQVKSPEQSKYRLDYYQILKAVPGNEAYRPLSESECPLTKK